MNVHLGVDYSVVVDLPNALFSAESSGNPKKNMRQ